MRRRRASDDEILERFVDTRRRLTDIPAPHRNLMVVLRWLVEDFQPGRKYPEAEVNEILGRRHPDFAALRRLLVDEELMQRNSGVYWRTGTVPNLGHDPGPPPPDLPRFAGEET